MSRVHAKKTTNFYLPKYNEEVKEITTQPLLEPYAGIVEPVILDNVKILKGEIPLTDRIQGGSTDGGGVAAGVITFSTPFTSVPVVTATVEKPAILTANVYLIIITGVTTTQFSYRKVYQATSGGAWNDAANETFNWIAFKP